jgi:hypothetical protein
LLALPVFFFLHPDNAQVGGDARKRREMSRRQRIFAAFARRSIDRLKASP